MNVGLVLEGGVHRSIYTAGVLDVLIDNNIFFPVTYAISSGALNALSYISKQKGRSCRTYIDYIKDKRFLSLKLFRETGSIYGFDFIFGEIAAELLPFDYDEFFRSTMQLVVGATDCETGESVYFGKEKMKRNFTPVIASSSLPVVTNIVEYEGKKLLAGAVSSSIPINKALKDGQTKNVIILTRDAHYVKKNKPDFPLPVLKSKYKNYPAVVKAMIDRPSVYNKERERCFELQKNGDAIVIQPSKPLNIGRYFCSQQELDEVYRLGVSDAKEKLADIRRFLALNA